MGGEMCLSLFPHSHSHSMRGLLCAVRAGSLSSSQALWLLDGPWGADTVGRNNGEGLEPTFAPHTTQQHSPESLFTTSKCCTKREIHYCTAILFKMNEEVMLLQIEVYSKQK